MLSILQQRLLNSISIKFSLLVSAVLLVAALMATYFMAQKEVDRYLQSARHEASVYADSLASMAGQALQANLKASVKNMLQQVVLMDHVQEIQLTDDLGKRRFDVVRDMDGKARFLKPRVAVSLPEEPVEVITSSAEMLVVWKPVFIGKKLGWIRLTRGLADVSAVRNAAWLDNMLVALLFILLCMPVLYLLMRKPVHTLKRYTRFADQLEENQNLEIDHSLTELEFLGNSLKQTAKRMQQQNNAINQAMLDLSALAAFPASNPNVVLSMNAAGEIEYLNPKGQTLLQELDFLPEQVYVLMPENVLAIVKRCIDTREMEGNLEIEIGGKVLLWTFAPVGDQDLVHAYAVDITSRRLAETQANLAMVEKMSAEDANHAKSKFLANMSHEIRTPLTAIIGFSESLLENGQSPSERQDAIQTIISSGKHLSSIINNILDLSKIEANKIEIEHIPLELITLVGDVHRLVDLQAQEKGIEFVLDFDLPLPDMIVSDPVRIKQVLLNLCSNAVKFTEQGQVKLHVGFDREHSRLSCLVSDTGVGMQDTELEQLFQPFSQADSSTTRRFGGTGLGLHLSKQLAERMGGTISVESTYGEGSCFSVTFKAELADGCNLVEDLSDLQLQEQYQVNDNDNVALYSGHVLLAEDNVNNQQLVNLFLRKLGAKVSFADNGQEAVDMASENDYDLILMDMQMPVMDGVQATRRLMENACRIPIVALTANVMKEDMERCRNAGCIDFLAKPIQREQFNDVISRYLTPVTDALNPLYSELLAEEPDMADLVDNFLAGLPAMLTGIQNAAVDEDWQRFGQLVHDMKSVGGSYGYPQLTEISHKIEVALARENLMEVTGLLNELEALCKRILSVTGMDEEASLSA